MNFLKMDEREIITKNTYNRIAEQWARNHSHADYFRREFEVFCKLLPRGKIVDVGCGAGRDYQFFQDGEYEYVGVDYSTRLLTIAKKQFPQAAFVEGNILSLPFRNQEFDGFWAAASLLHIPKAKIPRALSEIKRICKMGAVGFIALKKGEGEKLVTDDNHNSDAQGQRFFAYWQREEFEKTLQESGFRITSFLEHPVSERTAWLAFFVRM